MCGGEQLVVCVCVCGRVITVLSVRSIIMFRINIFDGQ